MAPASHPFPWTTRCSLSGLRLARRRRHDRTAPHRTPRHVPESRHASRAASLGCLPRLSRPLSRPGDQAVWEELSEEHSAGWWVSSMCMPSQREFERELLLIASLNGTANLTAAVVESDAPANSSTADAPEEEDMDDSSFAERRRVSHAPPLCQRPRSLAALQAPCTPLRLPRPRSRCYQSRWWHTAPPVAGAPFAAKPDGSPLPEEEAAVYGACLAAGCGAARLREATRCVRVWRPQRSSGWACPLTPR